MRLELGARPALSAAMHWLNTGYGIWNELIRFPELNSEKILNFASFATFC
jgi:hypothetical protein